MREGECSETTRHSAIAPAFVDAMDQCGIGCTRELKGSEPKRVAQFLAIVDAGERREQRPSVPELVSGPVAPSPSPGPTRCTIRPPSTRRATVRPFRKAVAVARVARSCARRSIKLPCNATMPANALIQSHLSGLAPMAANQLSDGAGWLPSVLAWFEDFVAV